MCFYYWGGGVVDFLKKIIIVYKIFVANYCLTYFIADEHLVFISDFAPFHVLLIKGHYSHKTKLLQWKVIALCVSQVMKSRLSF